MLNTETIPSVPFDENTYVYWLEGRTDCVIIDPGMQPAKIVDAVEKNKLEPAVILLTHGHSDHIFGNTAMKDRWPEAPHIIGHGDAYKLTDAKGNLSAEFGMPFTVPPADQTVAEGDTLDLAGMSFKVLETPGHSAGHVVFLFEVQGQTHIIGGDVLFRGSVGRSDFFDGDFNQLRDSIQQKLFPLPDESIVYPGHGPTTTIGFEKQHNPFVGAAASG